MEVSTVDFPFNQSNHGGKSSASQLAVDKSLGVSPIPLGSWKCQKKNLLVESSLLSASEKFDFPLVTSHCLQSKISKILQLWLELNNISQLDQKWLWCLLGVPGCHMKIPIAGEVLTSAAQIPFLFPMSLGWIPFHHWFPSKSDQKSLEENLDSAQTMTSETPSSSGNWS